MATCRRCRAWTGIAPALQLEAVVKKYRRGDEQVHALIDFDLAAAAAQ